MSWVLSLSSTSSSSGSTVSVVMRTQSRKASDLMSVRSQPGFSSIGVIRRHPTRGHCRRRAGRFRIGVEVFTRDRTGRQDQVFKVVECPLLGARIRSRGILEREHARVSFARPACNPGSTPVSTVNGFPWRCLVIGRGLAHRPAGSRNYRPPRLTRPPTPRSGCGWFAPLAAARPAESPTSHREAPASSQPGRDRPGCHRSPHR